MMKNILLIALYLSIIIFGTLLSYTGCRVFDFFSKGATTQTAAPYKPPARIETLEEELPAVNARINALSQALKAKDIEKTVLLFSPASRHERRQRLHTIQNEMPQIGEDLKTATLADIASGYTQFGVRTGSIKVQAYGRIFEINIVKINGEWYFQNL